MCNTLRVGMAGQLLIVLGPNVQHVHRVTVEVGVSRVSDRADYIAAALKNHTIACAFGFRGGEVCRKLFS